MSGIGRKDWMARTLRRAAVAMVLAGTGSVFAGVELSTSAPTERILSSGNTGNIGSRIIDIDVSENHARGQLFSLAAGSGAVEITAVTFVHTGSQTFENDTLTLRVFAGTEAQWVTGAGHVATNEDFYAGTTVTPLHTEAFTLDGTIDAASGQYVTLVLDQPVVINGAGDYGFFLSYDRSAASNPDDVDYLESSNGGRISISADEHHVSSRSMRYFVQGGTQPKTLILLGAR